MGVIRPMAVRRGPGGDSGRDEDGQGVMRRDLSLIRRLERIEKEMGYCQIKLEKEQRLAIQSRFLEICRDQLAGVVDRFDREVAESELHGNRLAGSSFPQVAARIAAGATPQEVLRLRERFRCVGLLPLLRDELELVRRELEELEEKLTTFSAFHKKKEGLEQERRTALRGFQLNGEEPVLRISREFEETEQYWNVLTEDLMNYDEALFHVGRAVDYLNSARNFVLSSRSQFSVEEWLRDGYLIDLFKHSPIGRTKEMVEGADRNLKEALRELLCLADFDPDPADFEQLLQPFFDALFDDLFIDGRLSSSLKLVERRLERAEKLRAFLEAAREVVFELQSEKEETRERLFHQIGDERRKLSLAPPA